MVVESGLYVVENGEVLKKADVLERTGDTGFVDVGQKVEDRGLAGTIRSDEAVELALFDIDRKIVDSL